MNQPVMTNVDMGMDNEALRLKAMELARREAALEQREREVQHLQDSAPVKKNWPKCYPLVHHDIGAIPAEFLRRKLAYLGYISWMVFCVLLFLNLAACFITSFYPVTRSQDMTTMMVVEYIVLAVALFIIAPPAHFFLSYWTLYKAMETGKIPRFILFFVGYAAAIIFCLLGVAGYPAYGFSGIVTAIYYFPSGTVGSLPGFLCNLLMGVAWLAMTVDFVVIFILGIKVFRAMKGSLQKIKEYGAGLVQSGAASAVSTAVKVGMSGNGQQQV